jgi:serine/threonine protein kinase
VLLLLLLQGTMSHMAPEALLHGRISKAGDVYAFGISLWELFTGGQAYQGKALHPAAHAATAATVIDQRSYLTD